MRARVRPDDGVCSDWFELEQGLRQGCVLSPPLYSLLPVFFYSVLTVGHQKFSEDTVILAELVHQKEPPTSIGPEPAMGYVRRGVWGVLYADDACIFSRLPRGFGYDDGSHPRGLPSLRHNCVCEQDRDDVHASTADDDASRSVCANLETGVILHLHGGRRYRNPGYVH